MPRALAYRAIGLGDLLTGVPALRTLRHALPDHEIVLAAPESQRPLVELVDAVDTLLPTRELEPVAWDGPPPEVGIDLHGNGPASRSLVAGLSPGRLVAFDADLAPGAAANGGDGRPDRLGWDPDEHERVRWCRLVGEAFGVDGDPDDVRLEHPPVAPPVAGAVIVHPGAASGSRRWPVERFAAVAASLADAGEQVVVTGSPDEAPLASRVARLANLPPDAVLAGRTDLGHLAVLVADARLVVAGDTGIAHLASAYATPSVLLFGPTPPSRWGPPPGPHTVLWHGSGVGDPHAATPDAALLEITVEEVLDAVRAVLRTEPTTAPSA